MSAATGIRARFGQTQRRLRRLRRIERALDALQAKRLRELHKLNPPARPTVMYDSITLNAIPANAPAVAGYVGGHWPTFGELRHRWPRAHRLAIAVAASEDADCLDVEAGDARIDQAPAWVRRQLSRGVRLPVVYTSVGQAHALLAALAAAGIGRGQVRLWTAHYTNRPHLCGPVCGFGLTTTADATQYTDRALGRNLDESLCAAGFWGRA